MSKIIDSPIEDLLFDDGEKIEIECSFPDAKTAIKALKDDPRYNDL